MYECFNAGTKLSASKNNHYTNQETYLRKGETDTLMTETITNGDIYPLTGELIFEKVPV